MKKYDIFKQYLIIKNKKMHSKKGKIRQIKYHNKIRNL